MQKNETKTNVGAQQDSMSAKAKEAAENDQVSDAQLVEMINALRNLDERGISDNSAALVDRLIAVLKQGHAVVKLGKMEDRDPKKRIPNDIFGRVNLAQWAVNEIVPYLKEVEGQLEAQGISLEHEIKLDGVDLFDSNNLLIDKHLLEVSRGLARLPLSFEAQAISQEYDFIRSLLHMFRTFRLATKYRCCKGCFRAIESGVYCGLHKSGHRDHYSEVTKVTKILSEMDRDYLLKKKWIRQRIGDAATVIPYQRIIVGSNNNSKVLSNYVHGLLSALENMPWSAASILIEKFLAEECPNVHKRIAGLTEKVSSFPEYVEKCYSREILNNRHDTSRKPLWFLVTVLDAEDWFEAAETSEHVKDGRKAENSERDQLIIDLYHTGMKIRGIAAFISLHHGLKVGSSTVGNVIKEYKRQMVQNGGGNPSI